MTYKKKPKIDIQNITIFCDASYCPETKLAGVGMWMRDNKEGSSHTSSSLFNKIKGASQAEFIAINYALQVAIYKYGRFNQKSLRYVMVSDCDSVVDICNGKAAARNGEMAAQHCRFLHLTGQITYWKLNKIKAHCGADNPRNWVNNHADRLAKAEMRKGRQSISEQLTKEN